MTPMSDERLLKVKVVMQGKASTISKGFLYGVVADLANEVDRLRADPLRAQVEALRGSLEKALEHVLELEDAWQRGCVSEHDGKGGIRSNRNVEVRVAIRKALDYPSRSDGNGISAQEEWEYRCALCHDRAEPAEKSLYRHASNPQARGLMVPGEGCEMYGYPIPAQRRNEKGEWV